MMIYLDKRTHPLNFENAIFWLKGNMAKTPVERTARKALALLAAVFFTLTIVGIPLMILGAIIWSKSTKIPKLFDTNILAKDKAARKQMLIETSFDKIATTHDQILPHAMPRLLKPDTIDSTSPYWKTMEGISLIADYLSRKNNLKHLYVCQTMEAFLDRLDELDQTPDDFKHAYIVPSYQPGATCNVKRNCRNETHQKVDFHAQHKIAVLMERKNGALRIFISDSMPLHLNMQRTYLDNQTNFDPLELVHAYLREANLANATYYYSMVRRHYAAMGGCETFALRDAVIFLRDSDYLDKIIKHGQLNPSLQKGTLDSPFYVANLPPENMKYSQSLTQLEGYIQKNAITGYDLSQKLGKSQRTLEESIKEHTRQGYQQRSHKSVPQNKTLEDRVKKYQLLLLNAIRTLPPEKLLY